jgi:sterol desaturase/sphingolipid hydroxylase (fatty acid hydroxylase superfamily)
MDAFMMIEGMEFEPIIRLSAFLGGFLIFSVWEAARQRRPRRLPRRRRWPGNLGITFINTLLIRLIFSGAIVGTAVLLAERGHGLLPLLGLPYWSKVVVTVLLFDLTIYVQHLLFHTLPALRAIHRMHHADPELDLTSGLRFHPFEMLFSSLIKLALVYLLGAAPLGVLIFEVVLNFTAMFNHANLYIPPEIDRYLRLLVVTPDMHRVHHSVIRVERNSNYGFNLPWWDRIFRTYHAAPRAGQLGVILGIKGFSGTRAISLLSMLAHPFLRPADRESPQESGSALSLLQTAVGPDEALKDSDSGEERH